MSFATRICAVLVMAQVALIGSVAANQPIVAPHDSAERGKVLVERLCSRCHAVGKSGSSPFTPAPPLRDIAKRYNIDDLAEAFAEGIVVSHPSMPVFEFSPATIGELLAYLRSLK